MVRQVVLNLIAIFCIHTYTAVTAALLIGSRNLFGSCSVRNAVHDDAFGGRQSMKAVSSSSYYPPQRETEAIARSEGSRAIPGRYELFAIPFR
jgi:hypothetical protein